MSRRLHPGLTISLACFLTALLCVTLARLPANAATSSEVSIGDQLSLTFYLPLKNASAAEAAAEAIQTPGNAGYHHFLSVSQFVSAYGPSSADVAALESTLVGLGFTIEYVYANHLAIEAVSTAGNAETVFGVKLNHAVLNGHAGIVPATPLQIPPQLVGRIRGVGGFNTTTRRHSRLMTARLNHPAPRRVNGRLSGGTPGNYLPADFANFYNVNPLYKRGVTGRGSTIGIVTLATFNPADAYSFWQQIGLNVSHSRITKVSVDGGDNPAYTNGQDETDLDVEESGAIAPDANIRVYIAPNFTNANFANGFEAAASENIADTISSSWGQPELLYFTQYNLATTGSNSESFFLDVFHDTFLEMALQGQTVFIAAGDSGSFDTVEDPCPVYGTPTLTAPTCNAPYAVDHPGSDPLVTASGGTTRPFTTTFTDPTFTVSVQPTERAWGWDYLAQQAWAQGLGSAFPLADWFSAGGGGGVSSYWAEPWYQRGVKGITATKSGQAYTENFGGGPELVQSLPANFAGRNVPDISTDADPYSGYQFITPDASGVSVVENYGGGTSFVAPQLNGVDALFVQALGGRVGQLNPAIDQLGANGSTDITAGDNWGYPARGAYDNAACCSLNAAKLLVGIVSLEYGTASAQAARARLLYSVHASP